MKNLQLSLKKQWFEMTKSGIKTEDYREMSNYWIKRLVDNVTLFGASEKPIKNVLVSDIGADSVNFYHVNLDVINRDVVFKKFDTNTITLGYPKSTDSERILKLEHKGIEIRTGNPDWGAEPEKLYFVIKHGKNLHLTKK